MSEVFFFIAAIGAVAGAAGTVMLRDAFYSVLSLVCHLIFLAMLFLLLRAEFVAAAQVIVYAGAVMVLYVFVVSYVGGMEAGLGGPTGRTLRIVSVVFAFALFVELSIALIGSGVSAGERYAAVYEINLSRCIFCGYCEIACPFDAITMGHDYEMADYNRSDLIFTKEMLLAEPLERTPLRMEGE